MTNQELQVKLADVIETLNALREKYSSKCPERCKNIEKCSAYISCGQPCENPCEKCLLWTGYGNIKGLY